MSLINQRHLHSEKSITVYSCIKTFHILACTRHDCPFAVFMFRKQPNDCWGFSNCINTKIIGSNIHICIHTCFKWGKTENSLEECEFTCEIQVLCCNFVSIAILPGWYVINGKYAWFFMLICCYLRKCTVWKLTFVKMCISALWNHAWCRGASRVCIKFGAEWKSYSHAFPIPIKICTALVNRKFADTLCSYR